MRGTLSVVAAVTLVASLVAFTAAALFFTAEPEGASGLPYLLALLLLGVLSASSAGWLTYTASRSARRAALLGAGGLMGGILLAPLYEQFMLGDPYLGFFIFMVGLLFFWAIAATVVVLALVVGVLARHEKTRRPTRASLTAFTFFSALVLVGFAARALAKYDDYMAAARDSCFLFC